MILIQAKSKTGALVSFEVDQILTIDGEPHNQSTSQLRAHLLVVEGRLQAVESILSQQQFAGV